LRLFAGLSREAQGNDLRLIDFYAFFAAQPRFCRAYGNFNLGLGRILVGADGKWQSGA
jgi:hypothetical protein